MILFIVIFCVIIALGFGLAAAWSDFNSMTIPNMYSALIAVSFLPAFAFVNLFAPEAEYFSSLLSHFVALGIVFAITYALFATKTLGGGDAKLCSAYALWVGVQGLAPLLFFMGLVGGILGLLTLGLAKRKVVEKPKKDSWLDKAQKGQREVPYGIAITAGAILAFIYQGYLSSESIKGLM